QEGGSARGSRIFARVALERTTCVSSFKPLDRHPVLSLGALGGERRPGHESFAPGGSRRLPADPKPDAAEIRVDHPRAPAHPFRRSLSVSGVSGHFTAGAQGILWVAMPGGNGVRVLVETGSIRFSTQFQIATRA